MRVLAVPISVAIPAYNAEPWIGATVDAVLAQTVPPSEVIVVDDGSTDGTCKELERFGGSVQVVQQDNRGAAAAYNRGFAEASGEYVAKCPADDLWEPRKLEWQLEAVRAHPEIDIAFGHARDFGDSEEDFARPPGTGLLDPAALGPALFSKNVIAAPTTLVRRSLYETLGGFAEDMVAAEDYDFWLRALRTGAVFYYDRRLLTRLRKHGGNLSLQALSVWELNHRVHLTHAQDVGDDALVRRTLAHDLRTLGRARIAAGLLPEARRAFRASLRYRPSVLGLAATAALGLPGAASVLRRLRAWRSAGTPA